MTSYRMPQPRYGYAPENKEQDTKGRAMRYPQSSEGGDDKVYAQPYTPGSMFGGSSSMADIMDEVYGHMPEKDDVYGHTLKNSFAYDMLSNFNDRMGSIAMGHASAGLSKDLINATSNVEQQQQANMARMNFGMQNEYNENMYRLKNQYANQEFNRDIGKLQATGEQARLTETNKIRTTGHENRLLTRAQGDENRALRRVEGQENRSLRRTEGDEARRLATHNDRIEAGKEQRAANRVRSLTRSI